MRNLPEEFKEVNPVASVEECIGIVFSIIPSSDTPHIDRYKLRLAKTYFMRNLKEFSTDQVEDILKHSYFKNFDGDFFKKAIRFSIKHQWVFPITFNAWFGKETTNYDRSRYLELINKNNNKEQLKIFCNNKTSDLDSFFRSHEPSYNLSLFAQQLDSKYVLYNKKWSKKELIDWFHEHKEEIPNITKNYFPARDIISKVTQEVYSEFLSNYVIHDEKTTHSKNWERPFIHALCVMPPEFWQIIEEKAPGLIREKISLPMKSKDSTSYISNYGQSLIYNLLHNGGIKRVLNAFEPYLDIGLMTMKETISNSHYEISSDAFEMALRNNIFYIFVPYAYNFDLLNDKQKEIMVAASFSWLKKDNKLAEDIGETYTTWAEKTLTVADTTLVKKYFKLNKNTFSDKDSLERIEILIRSKQLEDQLPEKSPVKKIKI